MINSKKKRYAGRGGEKLKFALDALRLDVTGMAAADFGCNIGGFTDCLLKEGAQSVYAVDTGYGMLEWKLRCDGRVTVMERTNAMHLDLPAKVDIVTVDVGWTRQKHILPPALRAVKEKGHILSLFKPQYEADPAMVSRGRVSDENFEAVLKHTLTELRRVGIAVSESVRLPRVKKRKNPEAILHILPEETQLPY